MFRCDNIMLMKKHDRFCVQPHFDDDTQNMEFYVQRMARTLQNLFADIDNVEVNPVNIGTISAYAA